MQKRPRVSRHFKRYRHGDVVLRQVRKMPEDAIEEAVQPLAYGETTGHAHQFAENDTVRFFRDGDTRFIQVLAETQLLHEEHAPLTIAPGLYEQIAEREYEYEMQEPPNCC